MSALELTFEPSRGLRRLEVINGAGGRRTWSADAKARILEETLAAGARARPRMLAVPSQTLLSGASR